MINQETESLSLSRHGISGILLLPLLGWFLLSFFYIISDPVNFLPVFFYSPLNTIFALFFVVIALYHLNFDIKYVLDKMFLNQNLKNLIALFFDLLSIIVAVSSVLSILQLHFMGIFIA